MDLDRHVRIDARLRQAIEAGTLPHECLVCGPAGTGKTRAILSLIHCLAADVPNLRVLIVRQTRVSLSESALVTFEQEVLPADGMEALTLGPSRRNRSSYDYPNGSTIVLGGMNHPGRITSTWWDIVFVNEAIELAEAGWDTLWSRLNRPGSNPHFGWLLGDTNPGDPSHWLKKRCDEGRTTLWDTSFAANPGMRDRAGWTAAGRRHVDSLAQLRGTRRKRYFEGLWAAGEGQWFECFADQHVSEAAGYRPHLPIHLAIDSGVHTAAVWFQVLETPAGTEVHACKDYYSFNVPAYDNALAILKVTRELTGGRLDRVVTDPAGRSATAIGPTVLGEYARAGLKGLESWPSYAGSVLDGLGLIDSFVAVDPPGLRVHPGCTHLITAFANYRRARHRSGQFIDRPEDPQHPHEDLLDALRGGLQNKFPEGRRPAPNFARVPARSVF